MTKYKIFADTHIFSPIEIMREETLAEPADRNTVFLGDIIDAANCKKSEVGFADDLMNVLMKRHRKNYISGNHSRLGMSGSIMTQDGVVFTHGDLQANYKKWSKYRSEPWGAGEFKRRFIIPFIREAELIINRKPSEDFLKAASDVARMFCCHTYVCGHFHHKELINISYNGIRIVIVPRGITNIDL